jgi:hypothetical protein
MMYPEAIEVNGQEYDINTGYEYALACFRCINDPDISDAERAYGVIGILFKNPPEESDMQEALRLALKYLRQGKEPRVAPQQVDMDFEADETYLKASFLSDYKIDLDDTPMHWYKFCTLLQGLTDDCVLNRVRDLRNYDLSTVKDPKTLSKIIRAQREVALTKQMSDDEQDTINNFYAQLS